MKNKAIALLLLSCLFLTACGGKDAKATSDPKVEVTAPSSTATEAAKEATQPEAEPEERQEVTQSKETTMSESAEYAQFWQEIRESPFRIGGLLEMLGLIEPPHTPGYIARLLDANPEYIFPMVDLLQAISNADPTMYSVDNPPPEMEDLRRLVDELLEKGGE